MGRSRGGDHGTSTSICRVHCFQMICMVDNTWFCIRECSALPDVYCSKNKYFERCYKMRNKDHALGGVGLFRFLGKFYFVSR